MTVYVDDSLIPARVGNLFARWSHLGADSAEELHAFAAALGLKREWAQNTRGFLHYDITPDRRRVAILRGAIVVDRREFVRRLAPWRLAAPPTEPVE